MKFSTSYIREDGATQKTEFDKLPDTCPRCNLKGRPHILHSTLDGKDRLVMFMKCASEDCLEGFISYYNRKREQNYFNLNFTSPKNINEIDFSEHISAISPSFVKIYNQAHKAEQNDLDLICGPGYRKSLEFLVKDYLISKQQDEDEKTRIKKDHKLSNCISQMGDTRAKEIAEKAAWLGNDETHYERKWADKDVQDLKALIEIVVFWIEHELASDKIMNEMSTPPKDPSSDS